MPKLHGRDAEKKWVDLNGSGSGGGITQETDPTVPAWAKESKKPTYTASEVGADASGTADSKISAHNTSDGAHNDIRLLITGLTNRLNALANSTDEDLDQLAEIVAYIKANKSLIDSVTTNKVSVTDIIDNLTTSVSNKPLSAKMGVELKKLIDAIEIPTTLPASDVYDWAKAATKPRYTASEVGALPASTKIPSKTSDLTNDSGFVADSQVYVKDETYSQTEVDGLIDALSKRLEAVADSDDVTLDQLSEIVAYIKANKSLIDSITTSKVSISDIVDNLTTGDSKKPLSAAQGKALKALYDAIPAWAKESSKPSYSKSDVGLGNVDNVRQYSASNPPPYPVKSVNGRTGAVTLGAADVGAATAEQLERLSEEIADYETLGLGVHSDGKLYIYKNGVPSGAGVVIDFAGDVVGTLDDSNNIILNGNLADGTYTLKFEMADGTYAEIGNLFINTDTTVYYSVSNALTNCTTNNSGAQVTEGTAYTATITANSGHELKTVTVTMGGTDITSSAVSGGNINIANVTGDIVITAVAEEAVEEIVNLIKTATNADGTPFVGTNGEVGYKADTRLSVNDGTERTGATGVECTGFIEAGYDDTLYFKNIVITSSNTNATMCFYDATHTKVGTGSYTSQFTGTTNGEVISKKLSTIATVTEQKDVIKYVRICADEITADSIITKNQPIE